MNKHNTLRTLVCLIFAGVLLSISACYKATLVDPPSGNPQWKKITQFPGTESVQNLIGTPFEVYTISQSQFARINRTDTLLSFRQLPVYDGTVGRPILDDNFFVRFTIEGGKDVIEFHSARNSTAVVRIPTEELMNATDNKIEIDAEARLCGAFNAEETQFVLLAIVNFSYSAFYFDIVPNTTYDDFVELNFVRRIDLGDSTEGIDELQVVRFIDGNYYVGTKSGGYRLTEAGIAERLNGLSVADWIIDFFKKDNRIIATNNNSYSQASSLDNGLSWVRSSDNESDLREIEVVGDTIFTHQALGFPWEIVTNQNLLESQEIEWSGGIEGENSDNNSFYGIGYSNGKFYVAYQKDVYYVEEVTPIEDEE